MIKKFFTVCLAVLAALSLSAMTVTAETFPSSVELSWAPVEGASYYDIYNGNTPLVRLGSSALSYTVEGLPPDTAFRFCVAARDSANANLDAKWVKASTGNWDGVYLWENLTDEDNHGKVRSIRLRIQSAYDDDLGYYFEIYSWDAEDKEYRIFPLLDFGDERSGEWISYKDSSSAAVAYRNNAERFNTSRFKPSKWRLDKLEIDYDSTSAYIQTSAVGMKLMTVSTYQMYVEDGVRKISFSTTSDSSLVRNNLFENPNPGEGPAFILSEI